MKKKGWIYFGGIVMCCILTVCGTANYESNTDWTAEMEEEEEYEETEEPYGEIEEPEETQESTYDLVRDVENGLIYYTKAGSLADPDGNIIPEYNKYYVDNEGYVVDKENDTVVEGYFADDSGKIVYREPAPIDDSSGIEKLRNYASWDNCTVSVRKMDLAYKSDRTKIDDDGDYFDEVVLGAWFDESGLPIGDILPQKLSDVLLSEANVSTKNLKFIDSESCTIDQIKRTSNNKKTIYSFVLTDIEKRENYD